MMKSKMFTLTLLSAIVLSTSAQVQSPFLDRMLDKSLVINEDGLVNDAKKMKAFVSDFHKVNGKAYTYKKTFNIEVSSILDYEMGELQTKDSTFPVMFLKRKDKKDGIELLVIYEQTDSKDQSADINKFRNDWMELCNAHKAGELVKQLYTSDAYYYNRGRLLNGTAAITQEYGYMNSPSYSLKLTPKQVSFVTSNIAYEIGRCSGSYPNPYMLLWERQVDGTWQVLMDTND